MWAGCAKEDVGPSDIIVTPLGTDLVIRKNDIGFRENVVPPHSFINYVIEYGEDYIIMKAGEATSELKVGDILILDSRILEEESITHKIEAIQAGENIVHFTTVSPEMDEIFTHIKLDISYFHKDRPPFLRNLQLQKQVLDVVDLEFSGGVSLMQLQPEFGLDGELVFDLDIDFENQVFNHLRFGVRDFVFSGGINYSMQGEIEGEASVSFPPKGIPLASIPLPAITPAGFPIPVMLDLLMEFGAAASLSVGGALNHSFGIENTASEITFIVEINPDKYPMTGFGFDPSNNVPISSLENLNFYSNFQSIQARGDLNLSLVPVIRASIFRLFDKFNLYVETYLPKFNFGLETIIEEDELRAEFSGNVGLEVNLGLDITGLLRTFGSGYNLLPEFEFMVYDRFFPIFSETIPFDCAKNINVTRMEAFCVPASLEEEVELTFSVACSNCAGSQYDLVIDGDSRGPYSYNSSNSTILRSVNMNNSSSLQVLDRQTAGCVRTIRITNPCETLAFCDGPEIFDQEGQEYCTMVLADGKRWMSSNLQMSFGGSVGICHHNIESRCFEVGRFYQHDELMNTNPCPSGYRVPSIVDWNNMLEAEKNNSTMGGRTVKHLFAPTGRGFGNVDKSLTNGFNILASGQYQGWKQLLDFPLRFTGSFYDEGPQSAMFWTSSPLDEASNNQFAEGGAIALIIKPNGTYDFVATSRNAGLTCRCIKN
jgi:uncharacterized protein (TIGR02145 family)